MRSQFRLIWTIASIVIVLSAVSGRTEVPPDTQTAHILQYALNRLYFSSGTESLVFTGCPFEIHHRDTVVLKGTIESSLPGISVSFPLDTARISVPLDSCSVTIAPYVIDSLTPISLTDIEGLLYSDSICAQCTLVSSTQYKLVTEIVPAIVNDTMQAALSLSPPITSDSALLVTSGMAPLLAVLIPNVTRDINQHGMLTTSLYYRFDEDKLPLLFGLPGVRGYFSLLPFDSSSIRPYAYAPSSGSRLLRNLRPRPRKVVLGATNPYLEQSAEYFADVLSRDRVYSGIVSETDEADCSIVFLPFDSNHPLLTLDSIVAMLAADTVPGQRINEAVAVAAGHLADAHATTDAVTARRLARLVQRRLMDDIGVFPLFRPAHYLWHTSRLVGMGHKPDQALDLSGLKLLNPPSALSEDTP